MIYDVVIQAISRVSSYRAQFESVIKATSHDELLEKIKARLR